MPIHPFLMDLVIVLGAALAVSLVFRPLRLPPTLGFMLSGLLIGPHALAIVSDPHQVETLADLGVTMLLFVIGLELSLGRLREYQKAFFLGGSLQVLLTVGVVHLALSRFMTPAQAWTAGCMVALSSTAVVLRLLLDTHQLNSPAGRIMTGILLFQDFAMVPMIALLPALGGAPGRLGAAPRLALGLLAAAVAFVSARYLMPWVLGAVAASGVRELFVVGAVFFCLGSATVTSVLGLSAALGAFLAGILVSESEYSHQVVSEILPFRDLFTSLFFVSVGMLLDPRFLISNPVQVVGLSTALILAKAVIVAGVVLGLGYPSRVAVIAGLGLSQIGEFSFVIARLGQGLGLLSQPHYQTFLAAAVMTLGATPFLIRLAPHAGAAVARRLGASRRDPPGSTGDETGVPLAGHVIIVGYGLNGRNLARVLRAVGIPYVVMDLDGSVVRRARREGETRIRYGDATRLETLQRCGVERAAAVVFAVADPDADRRGVMAVREVNTSAAIIVRTRLVQHVRELLGLGADEVIPEEFETSIAIFASVLRRLHIPENVIRTQERILRSQGYEFLREPASVPAAALERLSVLLGAGTTELFLVEPGSAFEGREIRETELRKKTGATVIAVVRNGESTISPPPEFRIQKGDVLVLVGSHEALERSFERLG